MNKKKTITSQASPYYSMALTSNVNEPPAIWVNDIDENSTKIFIDKLFRLDADKYQDVIPIFIDSFGGSYHSLMAMIDAMNACLKPISTIAIGKAMSAGAVLLTCGTKGLRFAGKNTRIMIHEVSSAQWGKTQDIKNDAEETNKLNDTLLQLIVNNTNFKSIGNFKKLLKNRSNTDWYMSTDEALRYNIIDSINVPMIVTREERFNDFIVPNLSEEDKKLLNKQKQEYAIYLNQPRFKLQQQKPTTTKKTKLTKPHKQDKES